MIGKVKIIKLGILILISIISGAAIFAYLGVIEERLAVRYEQIRSQSIKNTTPPDKFKGVSQATELDLWERENLQAVYNMYLRIGNGIELSNQIPRLSPENPNLVRVLVVGDSFVWGHGLLNEQTRYPELLEIELNNNFNKYFFKVSSLARFGGSTIEEAQWITKDILRKYQPDLIILGYVLNDIIPSGRELALCETSLEMCAKGYFPSKEYLECLRGESGVVNKFIVNTLSTKFPNLSKNLILKRCTPDWAKALDENHLIQNPKDSPYWSEFKESVAILKKAVGDTPIIWAPTNHFIAEKTLEPIKEVFMANNYIIASMKNTDSVLAKYEEDAGFGNSSTGRLNLTKAHASPVDPHPGSILNTAFAKDLATVVVQNLPEKAADEINESNYKVPSQLVISTNPANIEYQRLSESVEIVTYSSNLAKSQLPAITDKYPPQLVPCLRLGSPYIQVNLDQRISSGTLIEIRNLSNTSNLKIQEFGYSQNGEEIYGSIRDYVTLNKITKAGDVSGFLLIDPANSCDLGKEINFPDVKFSVTKM